MATDGSEPIYAPLHYAGKTWSFVFAQQFALRRNVLFLRQRQYTVTAALI